MSVVVSYLFFAAVWSTAGERAGLLARLCDVCLYFCHLPMLCPGSGVVLDLSIYDNCLFLIFNILEQGDCLLTESSTKFLINRKNITQQP